MRKIYLDHNASTPIAPEIAASTGSACHSGRIELSPVLAAMGVAPEIGMGAIRLSLGRNTTRDEVMRPFCG